MFVLYQQQSYLQFHTEISNLFKGAKRCYKSNSRFEIYFVSGRKRESTTAALGKKNSNKVQKPQNNARREKTLEWKRYFACLFCVST